MIDMVPFSSFPVRPRVRPGESLPGYIWRFVAANGHIITPPVGQMVAQVRGLLELEEAVPFLKRLVAQEELVDRYVALKQIVANAGGRWPQPWMRLSESKVQFCPQCLRESDPHLLYWELPLVSVCFQHAVRLVNQCMACGDSLKWSLFVGDSCKCGAFAQDVKATRAASWQVRMCELIVGADDIAPLLECPQLNLTPFLRVGYTAAEMYRLLHWALASKRFYEHGRADEAAMQNPGRRRRVRDTVPGKTEALFMAHLPRSIERAVNRIYRWGFKRSRGVLVGLGDQWHLAHMRGPLQVLKEDRSCLANAIYQVASEKSYEWALPVAGLAGVYLHPDVTAEAWKEELRRFARWWRQHAPTASVLSPGDELGTARSDRRVNLSMLNRFLAMARGAADSEAHQKLWKRWQVPARLTRAMQPEELLLELNEYLGSLTDTELMFIDALLSDWFSEHEKNG